MDFNKNIDDIAYDIYLKIRREMHFPTYVGKKEFIKFKHIFPKDYKLAEISLRGDKVNRLLNGR